MTFIISLMNHVSNAKICEIIFSDETFLTFFQDPAFYDFPSPSSPGFRSRFPAFPNELDDGFRGNSFEDQPNHSRHAAEPAPPTESIPIRVFHERTSTPPKNRLNAARSRNTTEIPASTESPSSNIQSEKSPRLERAHSEPPKMQGFSRLRPTSAASPAAHSQAYSTIPENSESNVIFGIGPERPEFQPDAAFAGATAETEQAGARGREVRERAGSAAATTATSAATAAAEFGCAESPTHPHFCRRP